jgi:hypothetical protein
VGSPHSVSTEVIPEIEKPAKRSGKKPDKLCRGRPRSALIIFDTYFTKIYTVTMQIK